MTQFKVDFNDFKRRDNTNLMEITLYNDSGEQITPNRDHQWSGKALKFGDGDKRLDQELAVTLDGDKIGVPSKQLENLPSGDYGLELWEVNNDSKTIYPSAGFVEFHIHRNADESLESVTPTIDLDKVIDDLHQAGLNVVVDDIEMLPPDATPSVTSEVRDGKNHIKLHIPRGLDNASLTTAPAFQALQKQVNNSAVGTNLLQGTSTTDNEGPLDFSGIAVMAGENYTFSGVISSPSTSGVIAPYIRFFDSSGTKLGEFAKNSSVPIASRTPFAITSVAPTNSVTAQVVLVQSTSSVTINYSSLKFEHGSQATDWCPNPTEILTQSDYVNAVGTNLAKGTSPQYQSTGNASQTTGWNISTIATFDNPQAGQKYTISVNTRTNGGTWKIQFWDGTSPTQRGKWLSSGNNFTSTQVQKQTATITWPSGSNKYLIVQFVNNNDGGQIDWNSAMLEKGTVAHDWSPAPEEILTQSDYTSIVGTNLLTGTTNHITTSQVSQFNVGMPNYDANIFCSKATTFIAHAWLHPYAHPMAVQVAWLDANNAEHYSNDQYIAAGSSGYSTYTVTIPAGGTLRYVTAVFDTLQNDTTKVEYKEFKLEKGSVATDWSLNPSEILTQSDYAKIKAAIVALGGSLS